jgi:hypothetical protein
VKQVLRTNPYEVIKSGSTGAIGGRRRRITLRDLLLVVQIAICAVLVTSSMVAVRGLVRSLHSNFGFEPRNAMLANTDLMMAGYSGDRMPAMQKRMIDAVQTIPGVTSWDWWADWEPLAMGGDTPPVFTDKTTDLRPSNAAAEAFCTEYLPNTSTRRAQRCWSGQNRSHMARRQKRAARGRRESGVCQQKSLAP